MIKVRVVLHSIFREMLPLEANGQVDLDLPDGACVRDAVLALGLPDSAVCAVNGRIEPDRNRLLAAGDVLRFLRPGAGG